MTMITNSSSVPQIGCVGSSSKAEIGEIGIALRCHQNVGRLYVTMDDLLFVKIIKDIRDLGNDPHCQCQVKQTFAQQVAQWTGIDIWRHHIIAIAIIVTGIDHR
jgi:hypothetical protein